MAVGDGSGPGIAVFTGNTMFCCGASGTVGGVTAGAACFGGVIGRTGGGTGVGGNTGEGPPIPRLS